MESVATVEVVGWVGGGVRGWGSEVEVEGEGARVGAHTVAVVFSIVVVVVVVVACQASRDPPCMTR